MVKHSRDPSNPTKSAKAMGHDLRVHFKTCGGSLKRKGKGNPRKKGLRGSLTITQDDLGFLSGNGIIGKLPRFANRITLKNISPGMKLWGVVVEVNKKDLAISLPGGLRGFVRAEQTTDVLAASEPKVVCCPAIVLGQFHRRCCHSNRTSLVHIQCDYKIPRSEIVDPLGRQGCRRTALSCFV
ncbi:uncharacterized protein LOC141825245 [Curcuma longa]|uniref:uncharacterized protein LOC141825245 n=1 Tax=Curcuma longa TaxID=136217 RepID=UPI003D9E1EFD